MVPGTSVFPLSETGMSGNFWGLTKLAKYCFNPPRHAHGDLTSLALKNVIWGNQGHRTEQGRSAPAACSCPGEKARSWGALGEARPGQSSLSAGS